MIPSVVLRKKISSLDGKDYGAYQALKGEYQFPNFSLTIDQIPKDPYAPPHTGIYRAFIKNPILPEQEIFVETRDQQIAFCDFFARRFFAISKQYSKRNGTGNSGLITLEEPSQAILQRNSLLLIAVDQIEIRFFIGLPANGRDINASYCETMVLDLLPKIVNEWMTISEETQRQIKNHIECFEDAQFIRSQLSTRNLCCFIADGSILPRESGNSDKPMAKNQAIPFKSPPSLTQSIILPYMGEITGMGIPNGICLIVGGGYHGKSTILEAIQQGIYNHIPSDGREYCISQEQTIKIRAYNRRNIEKVSIAPFISNLPQIKKSESSPRSPKDTSQFSTSNASGSTSQAANIMESLELGAKVLLMDEDTCATNFMIRDHKMQQLVQKEDEPITSFIDGVESLRDDLGVSTILVLGGIGDYFTVADTVIQMNAYQAKDVTKEAKLVIQHSKDSRESEKIKVSQPSNRILKTNSINPLNEYGKYSVYAKELNTIHYGSYSIDLTDLEQFKELGQIRALAWTLSYICKNHMDDQFLHSLVNSLVNKIKQDGLDLLDERNVGFFAQFRALDLGMVLNRLRSIKITF